MGLVSGQALTVGGLPFAGLMMLRGRGRGAVGWFVLGFLLAACAVVATATAFPAFQPGLTQAVDSLLPISMRVRMSGAEAPPREENTGRGPRRARRCPSDVQDGLDQPKPAWDVRLGADWQGGAGRAQRLQQGTLVVVGESADGGAA